MSRIVIDGRQWQSTTGRYVRSLVAELQQIDQQHDYTVLLYPADMPRWQQGNSRFRAVECPHKEGTLAEQFGLKRQLIELKADVVHFPMVQQPVWYKGTVVTTMNDLTTARWNNPTKNAVMFWLKQQVYKWINRRVVRKSRALMTYSEFVKQDIVKTLGADPAKITVTPLAGGTINDAAQPVEGLADQQFIMYVGRAAPHKNLSRLLDAFAKLKANHPNLQLVLAGKHDGLYDLIAQEVAHKNLQEVVFTNHLTEGQLRWLYENCAAYVFPSLSEGFGLPGLEAMAHGAPVVSSNATCLPEVYGEAAHYFDPLDVSAMRSAINDVLTDKNLRLELIKKGQEQVKKYSWQRTAEQTLAVYERALNTER